MKTTFDIHTISKTIEQSPLNDLASQELFAEWCQINDSILPQFLPRKQWEKLDEKQILQQHKDKLLLSLPQDLQLWEMMGIIRKIDKNTFKDKPEKHKEKADQLSELGKKFEKAGLYLANYFPLEDSNEEAKLAQDLAQQFYSYGCSLQKQEEKSESLPQKISLSEQELNEIDQRLLGREAYAKRLARLGALPSKEHLDNMRKELLTTAFKALTREGSKEQGEMPRELKKGPYYQLQEKVQEQLLKAVQTPETELYTAIFRRGKEKLLNEMPAPREKNHMYNFLRENLGIDLNFLKTKLIKTLNLPQLKSELEEVRKTGDIKLISKKELAIAKQIQRLVSSFEYQDLGNNPSEMVKTGKINCVGAALLGGAFLEELDINYLAANLLGHASTILITSDDKRYRQDFTPGTDGWEENYTEITPNMLENGKERVKIQDRKEGFLIFKNWNPYQSIKGQLVVYVINPGKGHICQILSNKAYDLDENKDFSKAEQAYKQAIKSDSNNFSVYNNLGVSLSKLGRNEEVISAYQKAIELNPDYAGTYNNLGATLSYLGRYEEVIEAYQKAIELDPDYADTYNNLGASLSYLGRYEEAIEAYQKFIQLADREDQYWIIKAQRKIEKLQEKLDEKSE
ncbi:MAG: hypothetical protein DLD55_06500 [candidate division SR1 bacterium]|nr:MAG: hypothetical protein DLD55_06500 [candidate division SR1 bacterium]